MTGDASKVGLHDHERFLRQFPPYSTLDTGTLEALARHLQVIYRPNGSTFDTTGGLFIIRRGEVDLNGEQYEDGETLGGGVRTGVARALTDTWLYVLPPAQAGEWLNHPAFLHFLTSALSTRLSTPALGLDLSSVTVSEIMLRPQTITPEKTVQEAAAQMRANRISSLMIQLPEGFGIITDKDLRNKVLAEGLPVSTPVSQIMTAPALTAPDETMALSALNLMFRRNIRHLPIVRGTELVGMVGTSDLLRLQTRSVGYVVQDLLEAPDLEELVAHAQKLPEHAAHLYRSGQKAEQIARLSSYAFDALYRRAIELVQAELGAAPGDYAWLLLGSIARRESGLNPDQDHLLLIEKEADRAYFHELAVRVEGVLNRAGLDSCDGGVMASQRLYTREEYMELIRGWYATPDPQALLNVTIYFDPRVVSGELDVRAVRELRLNARNHPAFMAHLTRLAVSQRPPLGFRQRLKTERDDTLDLKVQGLARIIDLARLHALHVGERNPSTFVRLAAPGESLLHLETREDLLGAYRYLLDLRMELQVGQWGRGQPLTNRLPVDDLSGPQEVHLREIFKLISRVQSVLAPQVGG